MPSDRTSQYGYFLMPEFHTWPDVQAAGAHALGTYISLGIWATAQNYTRELTPQMVCFGGGTEAGAEHLVQVGLWTRHRNGYKAATITQLQIRRGCRGMVMRLSRLIPLSPAVMHAGIGALGAWSLAASWSLTSPEPGFIPRATVKRLGIEGHVRQLCARDMFGDSLWERRPGGYWMSEGVHPLEVRWFVTRNDERVPVPGDVRERVYRRDGFQCARCGSCEDLALDHIYPWSRGGPDTEDNLQTLCRSCNSSKGNRIEGHTRRPAAARR